MNRLLSWLLDNRLADRLNRLLKRGLLLNRLLDDRLKRSLLLHWLNRLLSWLLDDRLADRLLDGRLKRSLLLHRLNRLLNRLLDNRLSGLDGLLGSSSHLRYRR